MGEVVCSVIFKKDQKRDLVLPDHIPVYQLVNSMALALNLSLSRKYFYELCQMNNQKLERIPGSRTLQQAFIVHGSTLHLVQVKESHSPAFMINEQGLKFRLRENTIIGRLTPDNHVDIDLTHLDIEKVVSRRHAAINHVSYHYVIKDLDSRNGTYLNGACLQKGKSVVLHPGDEICFGSLEKGVVLRFSIERR